MNPFMRMYFRRLGFGDWLVLVGGSVTVVGLLLLLVKLVIALSYLASIITLAGLAMLVLGLVLTWSKRRRRLSEDDMPYL